MSIKFNQMIRLQNPIIEQKIIFWLNLVLITTFVFLWKLPVVLGYQYDVTKAWVWIIPITSACVINLYYIKHNTKKIRFDKRIVIIFLIFIILWLAAIIRSAFFDVKIINIFRVGAFLKLILFSLFFFSALAANPDKEKQGRLRRFMVLGLGVYILSDSVFYTIGLRPHDAIHLTEYPAQMLSIFGIHTTRVLFPSAEGLNNFGLLAGLTLVGLSQALRLKRNTGWILIILFLMIVCGAVILLTDTRGALLFSVISITLLFIPKKLLKYSIWIPFVVSISFLSVSLLLPNLLSVSTAWLNREKTDQPFFREESSPFLCQEYLEKATGTLSNRPLIWGSIIHHLSDFRFIHVIGYGYRGHMISYLSTEYACLFESYLQPLQSSAHNVWLQTILDTGYLGLIILIILLLSIMLKLIKLIETESPAEFYSFLGMIFFMIMAGALEATITPDFQGIFIALLFISISCTFSTSDHFYGLENGS